MKRDNYGIEVLRILLMLMVVFLHCTGLNVENRLMMNIDIYSINGIVLYVLTAVATTAVNSFVIISGYLGVNHDFKLKKLFYYYLQGAFYALIIFSAYTILINKASFSIFELLKSTLIISKNTWWFLTYFFYLYLFKPFLDRGINSISGENLKRLCKLLILIMIIYPNILYCISFLLNVNIDIYSPTERGFGLVWFIILYILGASFKVDLDDKRSNVSNLIKFVGVVIFTVSISYFFTFVSTKRSMNPTTILNTYFYSYTSFSTLLASLLLVKLFVNLQIKNKVLLHITQLSKYTFGVYLFHEHPLIRLILEKHFYCSLFLEYSNSAYIFILICITILIIFIIGVLLDFFRTILFKVFKIDMILESFIKGVVSKWKIGY